jgi:hypothetical protein
MPKMVLYIALTATRASGQIWVFIWQGLLSMLDLSRTNSHESKEETAIKLCNYENKRKFAAQSEAVQNVTKWAVQDLNLWPPACKAGALAD